MADSGYRAFHDNCGGLVAFGLGDGYCTRCGDENVEFSDYSLVAVKPPAETSEADDEPPYPTSPLKP